MQGDLDAKSSLHCVQRSTPLWLCHQVELYDHLATSAGSASAQATPPNLCTVSRYVASCAALHAVVLFAASTDAAPEHITLKIQYNHASSIATQNIHTFINKQGSYISKVLSAAEGLMLFMSPCGSFSNNRQQSAVTVLPSGV